MSGQGSSDGDLEAEVVSDELVEPASAGEVRVLPAARPGAGTPALLSEVKTAAIVAAGGALAGAATMAAMRVVSGPSSRRALAKKLNRRSSRPGNVVASRTFLVDVHLLER